MTQELDTLSRAATSVADFDLFDAHDPSEADPHVRKTIENLRVVSRLAEAYRQVSRYHKRAPGPVPQFMWGDLEVYEKIGEGAFAEVFRAFDPKLSRDVALKLLKPSAGSENRQRRFIEEARLLAKIRHPNVLTIFGVDVHDGRAGLWADLLDGVTLEEWVTENGQLGPQEAAVIGMHMCRALAAVHRSGLIHGDIKPANIIREKGGRIVLLDFGTVREIPHPDEPVSIPIGTPLTMAPEVLLGDHPTPQSDVYSLGVVLYWMVAGRYPIEAERLDQLIDKHRSFKRNRMIESRPEMPRGFIEVVDRALESDANSRTASPGEFEEELAQFVGEKPTQLPLPWPWKKTGALTLVAALAVFFLWAALKTPAAMSLDAQLVCTRIGESILLPTRGTVHLGDQLHMEFMADRETYVFVFNQDDLGAFHVLFPIESSGLQNPLPANQRHYLPGKVDGEWMDWQVTSLAGYEDFLLVATDVPVPALADLIQRHHVANQQTVAMNTRGVGGLTAAALPVDLPQQLSDVKNLVDSLMQRGVLVETVEYRLTSSMD